MRSTLVVIRADKPYSVSYSAEVYEVIIAYPSDVTDERNAARNIISKWNDVHSRDERIVLVATDWKSHSAPSMSAGSAQQEINEQVLENADLLVAIFWTRIGSPTGKSVSGTVEEIETHIDAGKPAMLYFSSRKLNPDKLDEEQYNALKRLKSDYFDRGLVHEYETVSEFKNDFGKHLSRKVTQCFSTKSQKEALAKDTNNFNALESNLSEAAKRLLSEAVNSDDGSISRFSDKDGLEIQTNGKIFTDKMNPRSEAKWNGALEELAEGKFVEDKKGKGQVFRLTRKAYLMADAPSDET